MLQHQRIPLTDRPRLLSRTFRGSDDLPRGLDITPEFRRLQLSPCRSGVSRQSPQDLIPRDKDSRRTIAVRSGDKTGWLRFGEHYLGPAESDGRE